MQRKHHALQAQANGHENVTFFFFFQNKITFLSFHGQLKTLVNKVPSTSLEQAIGNAKQHIHLCRTNDSDYFWIFLFHHLVAKTV